MSHDAEERSFLAHVFEQSEERFRQMAAFSKDVFWVLDMEPPQRVYVNPAFREIWGFWPEGGVMTYEQWRDSLHPEDREEVAVQFQRARTGDVECNIEYRIVRPDGAVRYLHDRGAVIRDGEGRPFRLAGVAIDITDRVELARLKSEFISVVSHELRTPLTSIRASIGLIDGGIAGDVPESMRELLRIAKDGSERLTRLLDDLLDIEKIESGLFDFRMRPEDLVEIVQKAVDAHKPHFEERGILLAVDWGVDAAPVMADSSRLLQLMSNLLSNAAKFSPEGAPVELSVTRIGASYRVSVTDHGPGIPEEFRGRVFEKFAQADASSTREHGGTGLGLSIARSIVERHGGTIGFLSEAGQGTVFYFDLPAFPAYF